MISKPDQILVPISFSAQSLIALSQSYNLAKLSRAEITLLHVVETDLMNLFSKLITGKEKDAKITKSFQEKLAALAKEKSSKTGVRINTMIRHGKAYEEILNVQKEIKAKFIVMGTNDTSKFIGSNTMRVVRESEAPVITIKGSTHRKGCKNIILPLDFTKETREKVSQAISFARYFGSAIHVVSIITTDDEFIVNKLKRQLSQVKQFIEEKEIVCTAESIEGQDLPTEIISYAKKKKADLIMIMTQQELNFTEFFVGSAAQQIINLSDMPVLSIRPSGKEYSYSYSKTSLY